MRNAICLREDVGLEIGNRRMAVVVAETAGVVVQQIAVELGQIRRRKIGGDHGLRADREIAGAVLRGFHR